MTKIIALNCFATLSLLLCFILTISGCQTVHRNELIVFCGSASKPAMEEIAQAFAVEKGIDVYFNFGGSGTLLAQMQLSQTGDVYIPSSPDYIEMAEQKGVINPDSFEIIAYLVPTILVQEGNPKSITSLNDLGRPGITVGIGNPETVCVGLYAAEILNYNHLMSDIGKNIVTLAESGEKTANLLTLKSVDAVIGWRVFAEWQPQSIDVIDLRPGQIPRIAYIAAAISNFTKTRAAAQEFLDYLTKPQSQQILSKWGYITTPGEALVFSPNAQIGGVPELPKDFYEAIGNKAQ
jgi:molybdate transport system substrate-binding protein